MKDFSRKFDKDFLLEVATGSIKGASILAVGARNQRLGNAFEDIWDVGGFGSSSTSKLDYATSGETWEIVSSSTDDAAAGTGIRTVVVSYLDENYLLQAEILTLNGTTPVTFVATDALRFRSAAGLSWGSTVENQGDILVRVSSGGAARGGITLDDTVPGDVNGLNSSQDSHFTVEAGTTAFPLILATNVTKNDDVQIRSCIRAFGSDGFITVAEIGNYQNNFVLDLSVSTFPLPQKTDIKFIGRSSNTTVIAIVQSTYLILDNDIFNL